MSRFIKEGFNQYICQHDQARLQRGDDTDIEVAERAFEAGYNLAESHFNPFTGCKCKLYESERSKLVENTIEELKKQNFLLSERNEYLCINVIESHELKSPIHERTYDKAVSWLKNRNKE